tara:strand:- start:76103 stop:77605 length:1503 start_codon:yes stop_codon:yes gene_type:complete
MRRWALLLIFIGVAPLAAAKEARDILEAVAAEIGAAQLESIEYRGTGWYARFGQSFAPGQDFPRTTMSNYVRKIDYEARSSLEDLTRVQTDPPAPGGGRPFIGEQRMVTAVNGDYAWWMMGPRALPQPDAAELRQLEIWTTPHGVVKAALAAEPTAFVRTQFDEGEVTVVSFIAMGKYRVNAYITEENVIETVQTWFADPVLGDTLWEARYDDYKDVGNGVKFPSVMQYSRGMRFPEPGNGVLEVRVNEVNINVPNAAPAVPDPVRLAGKTPGPAKAQPLGDGVWLIGGGSHHSVAVEFDNFIALVEAPLDEARSLAVLDEVRRLLPEKPVRYVVNSHHHFDHAGGLRTFVALGSSVITHHGNKDFFEQVLLNRAPRTLQPDLLSLSPPSVMTSRPAAVIPVQDKHVLGDGSRTLELYTVRNFNHADTALIAYLPDEKLLINADMYYPPFKGASLDPAMLPGMRVLDSNILERGLDVEKNVPLHGRTSSHELFKQLVNGN